MGKQAGYPCATHFTIDNPFPKGDCHILTIAAWQPSPSLHGNPQPRWSSPETCGTFSCFLIASCSSQGMGRDYIAQYLEQRLHGVRNPGRPFCVWLADTG